MTLAKATKNFAETAIDDEIVVMNLTNGDFFSLTDSARDIWLRLDGGLDRAGLIAALVSDYTATDADIASEVDAFLAELTAAGLLIKQ